MSNDQISNTSAADFGRQAVSKWNSRDKNGAQGDALGFVAIIHAFNTMSFSASWAQKEDGKQVTHRLDFDMKDYMTKPCISESGKRDNKATQARTLAIMAKVFGVEAPTAAQLMSLRRCVTMVEHFLNKGFNSDDVKLSSRGYLEVPYVLMHDEPKADASERVIKTWNKNIDDSEVLDNTNGMSIAKFAQRIAPKETRQAQDPKHAKVLEFASSLNFVAAIVAQFNDDKAGESDVAPSKEIDTALFELKTRLETYFKANPIEVKGKKVA
jgi:hypothetical protein